MNAQNGTLGQSGLNAGENLSSLNLLLQSPVINCICDFHLQQDVRWWGEVERPRLCLAFLPGASFLTSYQDKVSLTHQPVTTPVLQRGSNDLGCLGDSDERETCAEESCPVWTEWSDWTDCPVTCGGGVQVGTEV